MFIAAFYLPIDFANENFGVPRIDPGSFICLSPMFMLFLSIIVKQNQSNIIIINCCSITKLLEFYSYFLLLLILSLNPSSTPIMLFFFWKFVSASGFLQFNCNNSNARTKGTNCLLFGNFAVSSCSCLTCPEENLCTKSI